MHSSSGLIDGVYRCMANFSVDHFQKIKNKSVTRNIRFDTIESNLKILTARKIVLKLDFGNI